MCVCMCVCMCTNREIDRQRDTDISKSFKYARCMRLCIYIFYLTKHRYMPVIMTSLVTKLSFHFTNRNCMAMLWTYTNCLVIGTALNEGSKYPVFSQDQMHLDLLISMLSHHMHKVVSTSLQMTGKY